jgi:hypothetical protein
VITRCQISLTATGSSFDPDAHGIPWSETDSSHPNRCSFASIHFDLGSLAEQKSSIRFLHSTLATKLVALRESGVTDLHLHVSWTYRDQCAGGFDQEELRLISELECDLAVDCISEV